MRQDLVSPESNLRDGGEREVLSTGGKREPTTGKGRYDLISPIMMRRLAIHYENGAKKYDTRNWEKGLSVSHCLDSLERHLEQYKAGDKVEDHLAAIIWNAAAVMHFEEAFPKSNTEVHDFHPVYQSEVWPK
jgi:hypothetical protein